MHLRFSAYRLLNRGGGKAVSFKTAFSQHHGYMECQDQVDTGSHVYPS